MKKIACVGYHFTGSGVIDDLLRECDNVSYGQYESECRILQDPDGVSDLEFHLVECPNRLKTGIAIDRFLRYVKDEKRMNQKVVGNDWMRICEEYINSITKFEFIGYHNRQLVARKPYIRYVILLNKVLNKLKPKRFRHPWWFNYFPKATEYHAYITESEFLEKTRIFIDNLCERFPQNEKTEYVVVDQMVAPNYPERYLRYVNNLKIIVVDRDPRDLYIYTCNLGDHILPKEPHQFCVQYRDMRRSVGKIDPTKVMYVSFEDMIYKYDEMVNKVLDFIGISPDHHLFPRTHFDPSKSIKGTKLWEKYPQYEDAVKIIEQELPDFIYQY